QIQHAAHFTDYVVIRVRGGRKSFGFEVLQYFGVVHAKKGLANLFLQFRGEVRTHGPGVLRVFSAVPDDLHLGRINQLAITDVLEDFFRQATRVGVSVGDVHRHSVV